VLPRPPERVPLERLAPVGLGTLPPSLRASDKPIAMACLRLVTVLPDLPLFRVPRFSSCSAAPTFSFAFSPYFATCTS